MITLAKALLPWLGVFVAIVLGITVISPSIEGLQIADDAPNYRSTRAIVDRHYEHKRSKGPSSYVVEFTYHVGDRNLKGSNNRTLWSDDEGEIRDLIRREEDGKQTMLVYYDPDDPSRVVIHKDVPRWPHYLWIGGTMTLFAISAIYSYVTVSRKRYLKKSAARLEGHRGKPPLL